MNLEKRIADLRADVQSDRMSMSIGELAGLYERNELDIHPKFQRILRWNNEQKTRLIESILLRIPIPPIFVAQSENGTWDVIDGVQCLGTIFEFLGILRGEDEVLRPALMLSKTVLLPELEGYVFNGKKSSVKCFSNAQRLDFRRSRLDLNIVLKESTPSSKYELFERLNTGGSIASPQEVRNCVMVWMNEPFFDWMSELCQDKHFQNTTPLSERLTSQQYRMELLLRFLVLYNINTEDIRNIKDLGDFLNEKNRSLAANTELDRKQLEHVFRKTFAMIDASLKDDAFRKYDPDRERFLGAFLISAFEAIAMGVAHNIFQWGSCKDFSTQLDAKVKKLWSREDFLENIGTGVSSSSRMVHTIPLGRGHFLP